jgi:hypothetical protein
MEAEARGGGWKRPALAAFEEALNRHIELGKAGPEILGFKAKRNARGDGEGGVCMLKMMKATRRKVLRSMDGQPIPEKRACKAAMDRWFELEVPTDISGFAALSHKPVYRRLHKPTRKQR